jgi:hypothetical protein
MSAETKKTPAPKRLTEAMLTERGHTHIVAGSLRWDEAQRKQVVTINTFGLDGKPDGNQREVATSDLHQCRMTAETKRAYDKIRLSDKRKAKAAQIKALLGEKPAPQVDRTAAVEALAQ